MEGFSSEIARLVIVVIGVFIVVVVVFFVIAVFKISDRFVLSTFYSSLFLISFFLQFILINTLNQDY